MTANEELYFFEAALHTVTGTPHKVKTIRSASGGMINHSYKVYTEQGDYFLKWNAQADADLFTKEQMGLQLLEKSNCLRVPKCIGTGTAGIRKFLVLELLEPVAPVSDFWENFGRSLARQHQITQKAYGLDHDNHIGRLHQINTPENNWIDFFIQNRLNTQLKLALDNQLVDSDFVRKFSRLSERLSELIPQETPALLHGDLWNGNFMSGPQGKVSVFDPAVYFGHREMELAFTYLFGGFDRRFYQSYHEYFPLTPGFEDRMDIHNLYPLLVHVNLFGPSYLTGIHQTLRRFL